LEPDQLIALDIDETELYRLENELDWDVEKELITLVADVSDEQKIERIISEYTPDVVFHAAAYKHVPMMERFPEEAIKVNVRGTQNVVSLCCRYNVPKFVLISTDKAVNPTNVMGATKRIAEQICMAYNSFGITKFISVRFGNVLGSRGSVVPLFMNQINNGGPITITDPEVERYFMTIPEAVLLVMQAGSMGQGSEVFVLDMGEPVKILDMAKELIRLNGLEPEKDIPLVFKGLRPGEKMYEELLNTDEGAVETEHEQIYKANCSVRFTSTEIDRYINSLTEKISNKEYDTLRYSLKEAVPTYRFNGELEEVS
jgi:FlaA1/EpsC-like NDP-sugar epimerase